MRISCLSRRIAARLAALFAVFFTMPLISSAQSLNPLPAAGITSSVQSGSDTVTDIFVGKGSRGPYVLNWKKVDENSEVVLVNGAKLRKGQNYSIDYVGGVVAFSQSLNQGTIARVTYRCTKGKAVQNNTGISIPLNLTLMQKTGHSLGLTGMLKQGDGTSSNPGMSVFGLNMASDIGSVSKLTSQFMMSSVDDGAESDKGGFWDRSALSLGNDAKYGDVQVKTSFIRTGQNFAAAKEYKLKQGQQLMDMMTSYNPSSAVSASMSFKRTDDIGGKGKGTANTLMEQRVVLTFPKAPKMTLTHNVNEKETPGGVTQKSDVSKMLVEHNFGKKTTASAFVQNAKVDNGGTQDTITTSQFNFKTTPTPKLNLASQLVLKNSELQGDSSALTMKMNAAPTKAVKMALGYSQLDAAGKGTATDTNLQLTASAAPGVNVEATYDVKSVDNQGDVSTAGVKVAAAVNPMVNVKTSLLNTQSSTTGGVRNRDVAVEAKPAAFVKLSMGLGQKDMGDQTDNSRNVHMEVKAFENTTLGGGYQYSENGNVETAITDFSAQTRPLDCLQFSGFYKMRDVTGLDDLDTMTVQWKLDPVNWLKLNGQYARNPEDKHGAVQQYDTRTVGVESKLGLVSLKGGYTSKDDYALGREAIETQVGMSLRVSDGDQLTTGYKVAQLLQGAQSATITYTLGYSHSIGSDFNLSLSGSMTQYEQEQVLLKDQTEYEANLKLGLQF